MFKYAFMLNNNSSQDSYHFQRINKFFKSLILSEVAQTKKDKQEMYSFISKY